MFFSGGALCTRETMNLLSSQADPELQAILFLQSLRQTFHLQPRLAHRGCVLSPYQGNQESLMQLYTDLKTSMINPSSESMLCKF